MTLVTTIDGSSPRGDVEFLARSAHRVDVLTELAERSRDRGELRELTGASSPTLGRILGDFETRRWVVRDGSQYELTQLGEFVAERFVELLEAMEVERTLRDVWQWLPLSEMNAAFGLHRLAGATITMPTKSDSIAPVRRAAELLQRAERARLLTCAATPHTIEGYRNAVTRGIQLEAILSRDAIAVVRADPQMSKWFDQLLTAENATVYRYDGPVHHIVGVGGGVAGIGMIDDTGTPRGYIDTNDDAVRVWVERIIDCHRARAERMDADAFAGMSPFTT